MRKPMTLSPMARHQSGVALIVVLLFLILITIAGAIAVRQSRVDLNVATSDQAGAVMLNSSDSVLAHIEQVAGNPQHAAYANIFSQKFGIFGHYILNPKTKIGDEISFCYRPNDRQLFSTESALIRYASGGTSVTDEGVGICDPTNSSNYTSARQTSMTQVVLEGIENELADNFNEAQRGTSEGGSTENISPKIQINSISLLPAMSQSDSEEITTCLGRSVGDAGANGNINDCLRRTGIPANVVVEEGLLEVRNRGGVQTDTGTILDVCATPGTTCATGPAATPPPSNP